MWVLIDVAQENLFYSIQAIAEWPGCKRQTDFNNGIVVTPPLCRPEKLLSLL